MCEIVVSGRTSSKRSVGRKLKPDIFFEKFEIGDNSTKSEEWTFGSLKKIVDDISNANIINKELICESLEKNVQFFSGIKAQLESKFSNFEENFVKPFQGSVSTHRISPIHRSITRTQSQILPQTRSLSLQPTIRPIKRMTKTKSQPEQHQKQLPATAIWNSVQRFFNIVPTPSHFSKILSRIDLVSDQIPLGAHYSITINRKLSQRFRNDSVMLKIPHAFLNTSSHIDASPNIMFNRLLSSFIPLINEDNSMISHKTIAKFNPMSPRDLNVNDDAVYPSEIAGTSFYSSMTFSEKLPLEIKSLGLNPNVNEPCLTDNEVMNEIHVLERQYNNSLNSTNEFRSRILKLLTDNESKITERAERIKGWGAVIEKCEQIQKKQQGRPKSRDKLF